MKWNEILMFWVFFQVGNWMSYYLIDTSLKTCITNMFFTGFFAIYLAIFAKVKTWNHTTTTN